MALRDELKQLMEAQLGDTDAGFRGWVEGKPVELSPLEAQLFPIQYSRMVLECVYRLADEIDAITLNPAR